MFDLDSNNEKVSIHKTHKIGICSFRAVKQTFSVLTTSYEDTVETK